MIKDLSVFIILLFLLSLSIYAQELKSSKDNDTNFKTPGKIEGVTANGDKITVKDEDSNVLMEVTDEGDAGSIFLEPLSSIGIYNNKLYNMGGSLIWNGNALGTAGSAGGWTDEGPIVRLSSSTDKVGIGTTNPLAKLSVGGDGNSYAIISATAADYQVGVYAFATGTSADGVYGEAAEGNGVSGVSLGTNGHGIHGEAPQTGWAGYFDGRGYFSSNVGIGTTDPSAKLTIRQDVDAFVGIDITNNNTGSNSSEGIYFNNEDGTIAGIKLFDDGSTYSTQMHIFNNRPDGSIHLFTPGGHSVFDRSGNFAVYSGDILVQGLNSFHTNNDEAVMFLGDNNNYVKAVWGYGVKIGVYGINSSAISILAGSGNVGIGTENPSRKLWVNGSAGGTENWNAGSDRRLKKNIETIPNALEKLNNLRGVNFEWRDTKTHSKGLKMGFIAQEAKEVIPEVVSKRGEYYSMQYAPITALLVEAVKEQNSEFRSRNAEFRTQNAELRKEIKQIKTEFEQNQIILKQVINYLKIKSDEFNVKVSKK